jgi:flagellar biosynthesis protein FlhF
MEPYPSCGLNRKKTVPYGLAIFSKGFTSMKIKKYTARSMKEALLQIKQELGEDAIILKTSKPPRKMFPLSGRDEVEVTAAVDDAAQDRKTKILPPMHPIKTPDSGIYARPKPTANVAFSGDQPGLASFQKPANVGETDNPLSQRLNVVEIKEDIRELGELLKPILLSKETGAQEGLKGPWVTVFNRLLTSGVDAEIARAMIMRICGSGDVSIHEADRRFSEELNRSFPVSGPIKLKENGPLVCAFVGPTGVGKTTTLAKLAAHYRLNKNKAVSIVTADTYRIAAIDQIRTFADIMHIRLEVVFSPDEVAEAMAACARDDIVFVDTAGRSPSNAEHMRDLEGYMKALRPDEVHLVLSATTKDHDLFDAIAHYRCLGANRVLFTKFDETGRLGNVFNAVVKSGGVPVSYFTFGQSVPDDIELAQPGRFIRRLWKESIA